jgi:hypothetical protein
MQAMETLFSLFVHADARLDYPAATLRTAVFIPLTASIAHFSLFPFVLFAWFPVLSNLLDVTQNQ